MKWPVAFFVIGQFVLPIQFVLTLAFDRTVLYGNDTTPFLVY